MAFLRSERYAAFLLIGAAALGLVLANSLIGESLIALKDVHTGIAAIGLDVSLGHWVTDGLLAIFFFIAAIELRHELTNGELDSPRKALVPVIAAVGGVIAPAIIYLLLVRDEELANGWPIPTATDIAFALGVLALVGRFLPTGVRALLLALAVIDDLIAILIIAIFFTTDLDPLPLLFAVPLVLVFGWLSLTLPRRGVRRAWTIVAIVAIGVATWALVYLSGVHATVAGVALGLIMASAPADRARHILEPWSNGLILPVFAFTAALVPVPTEGISNLSPAFWGIVVALPVGKLLGITAGATIAMSISRKNGRTRMPFGDLLAVAALGGVGFTVSLLMNELAFAPNREIVNEGTLAVILASIVAAAVGIVLTAFRSRHYARLAATAP